MRASESDRGLICPASLVLPRNAPRSKNADKAAEWGNLCHRWKETGDTEGNKTLIKKIAASGIDRDKLWPKGKGQHEFTFSINLATLDIGRWGTSLGYDKEVWKKKFDPKKYLTGTIDFWAPATATTIPWVDDLKTGAFPVRVKKSKQLKSYALLAWIMSGCETDVLVSITQWPKYRLDCRPKRRGIIVTSLELAKHLKKIRWAVSNPKLTVRTSEGCMFCACKPDCPEFNKKLRKNKQ